MLNVYFQIYCNCSEGLFCSSEEDRRCCLPPVLLGLWEDGNLDTCSREYLQLLQSGSRNPSHSAALIVMALCNKYLMQIAYPGFTLHLQKLIFTFKGKNTLGTKQPKADFHCLSYSWTTVSSSTWAVQNMTTAGSCKAQFWHKSQCISAWMKFYSVRKGRRTEKSSPQCTYCNAQTSEKGGHFYKANQNSL